jgi:hypothetical protein
MFTAFKVHTDILSSQYQNRTYLCSPTTQIHAAVKPPTNSNYLCNGEKRMLVCLNFTGAKKSAASSLYLTFVAWLV